MKGSTIWPSLEHFCLGLACVLLLGSLESAGAAGSEQKAHQISKAIVGEKIYPEVLALQGDGSPTQIKTWVISFYDPALESKIRQVTIIDNKVEKFESGKMRKEPRSDLVFDPSLNKVPLEDVLKTAQRFAEEKQFRYDNVKVTLGRRSPGQVPVWRIEMLQDKESRGTIYTKENKSEVDHYEPAKKRSFFDDVADTFTGIGGDLEEFFTGDRTVDQ